VARSHIEAARPGLAVAVAAQEYYHPADLQRQVARSQSRGRSDIVVIDVGAFFVAEGPGAIDISAFPRRLQSAYDRLRHLRATSRHFVSVFPLGPRLVQLVETGAIALAQGLLRPLARRYPRPSLAEYEVLLDGAVRALRGPGGPAVLLQGPGGFNPAETSPTYAPDTQQVFEAINALAKRVAAAHGIPCVDRMDAVGRGGSPLHLPDSSRYSARGHQVMGRLLGESIVAAGLV
jgi:hypothetical protein